MSTVENVRRVVPNARVVLRRRACEVLQADLALSIVVVEPSCHVRWCIVVRGSECWHPSHQSCVAIRAVPCGFVELVLRWVLVVHLTVSGMCFPYLGVVESLRHGVVCACRVVVVVCPARYALW